MIKNKEPEKLQKRSWPPYCLKGTDKWYTGYDGLYDSFEKRPDLLHEVRELTLTPERVATGRSAANMIFKDKDGTDFWMSLRGGFELVKGFIAGDLEVDSSGKYFKANFTQVKKGANIFIEIYDEVDE